MPLDSKDAATSKISDEPAMPCKLLIMDLRRPSLWIASMAAAAYASRATRLASNILCALQTRFISVLSFVILAMFTLYLEECWLILAMFDVPQLALCSERMLAKKSL